MSGPLLARGLERVGPGAGGGDPEARLGQVVGDQRGDVGLVVDDENAVRHAASSRGSSACRWGALPRAVGVRAAPLGGAVALGPHRRCRRARRRRGSPRAGGHACRGRGGAGRARTGRSGCPAPRSTRRSTWRWRDTVGWGRSSTACRSDTKRGAAARQLRIRSRVGSATVRRSSVAEGGRGVHMRREHIYTQANIWQAASADGHRRMTAAPPAPHISPRCSPSSPRSCSPPLRSRTRRTSCSSPPPTSTATSPTGTTCADRPFAGGLARVATVVDSLRAPLSRDRWWWWTRATCCRATPFATYFARVEPAEPHPIIEAMNLAGYDAATPGNHDFDWGLPFLPARRRRGALSVRERQHLRPLPATRCSTRRTASSSARASASRSPAFTTPGTMVWDRDQLGRPRRASRRSDRHGAGASTAMRRDADVVGRAGPLRARRPRRPTTRPVSATRTWRPRWRPSRPAPTSWWSATRTARSATRCSTACTSSSRRRSAPASRWCISTWRATTDVWRVRRIRADLVSTARGRRRRRCWRSGWARHGKRCARGPARPSGSRLGSDAGRRGAGRAGPDHRASSRTCSAAARAPSSRRPRPSTSGPVSTPTRSGVAHVLALYPFDNTLRAVRVSGAQLKAYLEWSARYFLVDPVGPDRAQRLGAGLRLRRGRRRARTRSTCGGRSATRIRRARPCAGGRSSRATASRWPSTATARPAPAATTCSAARPWSTTRASGSPTC